MLLHFIPADPLGHIALVVHCCEHTGWPAMSMVPVHTPLMHSVDMLLTIVHAAPNVPGAGPAASGVDGGGLPEQAQTTNDHARSNRCMARDVTMTSLAPMKYDVIGALHRLTSRSPDLSAHARRDLPSQPLLELAERRPFVSQPVWEKSRPTWITTVEDLVDTHDGVTIDEDLAHQVGDQRERRHVPAW